MESRLSRPTVGTAVGVLVVLLALVVAGCTRASNPGIATASGGQGSAPAAANPSPTPVDEADAALAYAQCIRANGYPEWPDPDPEGRIMLDRRTGISFNDPRLRAAQQACQDVRPAGAGGGFSAGTGGPGAAGAADEEAMFAFARCMRENGVPGFPDPSAGGGRMVVGAEAGINPNDPKFRAAQQTCMASLSGEAE
jgi:hypothetical protein